MIEIQQFQLANGRQGADVLDMMVDPNEETIRLVCPANADHWLDYPVGLLDVEPAPWCMCVDLDSTIPLSERNNRMRPKINRHESIVLSEDST